jgi:small subunit ribosomal protein S21
MLLKVKDWRSLSKILSQLLKFKEVAAFEIVFYYSGFAIIFAASKKTGRYKTMLIIDSKDCENIDKALKKYKKKFEKSKILLQLRERQSFTKPSVKRRSEILKAVYKQKIASGKIAD